MSCENGKEHQGKLKKCGWCVVVVVVIMCVFYVWADTGPVSLGGGGRRIAWRNDQQMIAHAHATLDSRNRTRARGPGAASGYTANGTSRPEEPPDVFGLPTWPPDFEPQVPMNSGGDAYSSGDASPCGDATSSGDAFMSDGRVDLLTIITQQLAAIKASVAPSISGTRIPDGANKDGVSNRLGTTQVDSEPAINTNSDGCDLNYRSRHLMTVSNKEGRLGNDLFQMAMLLATARRYCYTAVVPPAWSKLLHSAFTVPDSVYRTVQLTNVRTFDDWQCCHSVSIYNDDIDNLSPDYNWTFCGYFQSFRYLHGQEDVIRSYFQFRPAVIAPVSRVLDAIRTTLGDVTIIAVHVRRGDMAHNSNLISSGFAVADIAYLQTAMLYYRKCFRRTVFIMVSDEIQWCRDNIHADDVVFSPLSEPAHDMALIAHCNHVIITSGSFGWWGAWLNGGTVVYFRGFPAEGSRLGRMYNKTDYYPKHWIGTV